MSLPFTAFDALVVLAILASAGYAAWRGFVSETLSIFAWLAAAFGCLYFGPYLIPMARDYFSAPWAAALVAYAVVFLAIFIPLSFMSHRFAESVRHGPIGPLDRALGIAFGVLRGLVLVGVLYLAYSYVVPIPRQPRWLQEARTLPMIQATGQVILSVVPDQTRAGYGAGYAAGREEKEQGSRQDDGIGNLIRENENANRAENPPDPSGDGNFRERPPSPPRDAANGAQQGYGARDRRALDTLINRAGEGANRER